MIISVFNCLGTDSGDFFGIFNDKKFMKNEYIQVQNNIFIEGKNEGVKYRFGKCIYKQNRKLNTVFKFQNENVVLIKPTINIKYDIKIENTDKISKDDRLLVFLDRTHDGEMEFLYLINNEYTYVDSKDFMTIDDFKKYYPKINI